MSLNRDLDGSKKLKKVISFLTKGYQRQVIKKCNCTDWYFVSVYADYENCNDIKCPNEFFFSTFVADNFMYLRDVCMPECPLECYETLYQTSTTSYQLIGDHFIEHILSNERLLSNFINRTIDAHTARESFVRVNIFYDSLSYVETTESPQMDLISLLASIGGNLSLFLGVSVLSLFELVEVALIIFSIKFLKTNNTRNDK